MSPGVRTRPTLRAARAKGSPVIVHLWRVDTRHYTKSGYIGRMPSAIRSRICSRATRSYGARKEPALQSLPSHATGRFGENKPPRVCLLLAACCLIALAAERAVSLDNRGAKPTKYLLWRDWPHAPQRPVPSLTVGRFDLPSWGQRLVGVARNDEAYPFGRRVSYADELPCPPAID